MGRNLGHDNFIPLGYPGMRRTDYGPAEAKAFRDLYPQLCHAASQTFVPGNKPHRWELQH